MGQPRLNLKNITGLLADRDMFTRGLIAQMLRGFGIEKLLTTSTGEEAKHLIVGNCPDICFVEGALPDMATADFVGWIRRQSSNALRFMPVLVLSGYTQLRLIAAARDGGAHIVIRKPVSPQSLFDRINWVARVSRPFLETSTYVGPDRRFHSIPPPDSKMKRATDVPLEEAATAEAN
ncbi:MAG: response regulator [Rhizomicrobium sp.]